LNPAPFQGGRYQPLEVGPAPPASHRGRIIGAVAAVLVAVVAVGGYLAAGLVTAASDRQAADAVVGQARKDNNQVAALVKTVPSGPSSINGTQDLAKAKITADSAAAAFDQGVRLVTSDLPRLRQADATLQSQSGSFLVATQRGSLDKERARVDSVVTAFSAAHDYFQLAGDQMRFNSSMLDAEMVLLGAIQEKDLTRALAAYANVDSKVQHAVTLSKGPNIAPAMQTLMGALATLAADFKQLLQAAHAGNLKATQAAQAKVTSAANAVGIFDQKGFDEFEAKTFKPYQDRYDQALRQAGFSVIG
jgi:hypothetical protein